MLMTEVEAISKLESLGFIEKCGSNYKIFNFNYEPNDDCLIKIDDFITTYPNIINYYLNTSPHTLKYNILLNYILNRINGVPRRIYSTDGNSNLKVNNVLKYIRYSLELCKTLDELRGVSYCINYLADEFNCIKIDIIEDWNNISDTDSIDIILDDDCVVVKIGNVNAYVLTVHVERAMRKLQRNCYHSGNRNISEALEAIPYDEDGIRRSFGIEYEIYSLTADQENKLCNLLDSLDAKYVSERDGSLLSSGVELVFMPVGAQKYVEIVTKLGNFIRENNVEMYRDRSSRDGAGMHTTYGVSNHTAPKNLLQKRLNRIGMLMYACSTARKRVEIFGRDFGSYRDLPDNIDYNCHSNALSCNGRPENCWEFRLPNWECDPEKIVKFFKITEWVFTRPYNKEDFNNLYDLLKINNNEGEF